MSFDMTITDPEFSQLSHLLTIEPRELTRRDIEMADTVGWFINEGYDQEPKVKMLKDRTGTFSTAVKITCDQYAEAFGIHPLDGEWEWEEENQE